MMSFNKLLNIHESWNGFFIPFFKSGVLTEVLENISKTKFIPSKENVFRSFSLPEDSVKVVIIGQDPYPNPTLANGIAFSVPNTLDSASLRVIRDELFYYTSDIRVDELFDASFQFWMEQGIMMLNSALTTIPNKTGKHFKYWYPFMKDFILYLDNLEQNLCFVLLGKQAQKFEPFIKSGKVLKFPHPAADKHSATNGFGGSGIFRLIDEFMVNNYNNKIQWLKESE